MDETFEGRFAQAQLLWGNIAARPMRAFLNIVAITIQVFLVLMIVGLTTGVVSEWASGWKGSERIFWCSHRTLRCFLRFRARYCQSRLRTKWPICLAWTKWLRRLR